MATHRATLTINAPAREVFDALTQVPLVERWQYGKTVITTWEPGSSIRFRTEFNDNVLEQWGTVLEVRPNELIRYSLFTPKPGLEDRPDNYHTTSYLLSAENGTTRVELVQEDPLDHFVPVSLMPVLVGLKKAVENISTG